MPPQRMAPTSTVTITARGMRHYHRYYEGIAELRAINCIINVLYSFGTVLRPVTDPVTVLEHGCVKPLSYVEWT